MGIRLQALQSRLEVLGSRTSRQTRVNPLQDESLRHALLKSAILALFCPT